MPEVKVMGLGIELDFLLKLLIQAAGKVGDMIVKGDEMDIKEKKYLRTLDLLNQEWGEYFAAQTDTELDDAGVEELKQFVLDTAQEGGFLDKLVELPSF